MQQKIDQQYEGSTARLPLIPAILTLTNFCRTPGRIDSS